MLRVDESKEKRNGRIGKCAKAGAAERKTLTNAADDLRLPQTESKEMTR